MAIKIDANNICSADADMSVVFVCEKNTKQLYADKALLDIISKALAFVEFKGKKEESLLLYGCKGIKAKRVLFCGVGKGKEVSSEVLRSVSGTAVARARELKLNNIAFASDFNFPDRKSSEMMSKAIMEGASLANYSFDKYKTQRDKSKILTSILIHTNKRNEKILKRIAEEVEIVCDSVFIARDWVNTPSNDKKPECFAHRIVKDIKHKDISVTLLLNKKLKEEGMNGILSVGAGSESPPVMLILEYKPQKKSKKSVVLVGKGVTFDSGGINLKPTDAISDMKMDMSGAAAVAATILSVAKMKMQCKVTAVIPIVENMPSGSAIHPGDIIKTYSGKTVEIENTDAEGRIILSDALAFAEKKYKPDIIIDMATLTGACMVALGTKIAGVFSFDKELARNLVQAGDNTFERCWAMPMPEDYKKLMKSEIADIKNISSTRWGGAITGAIFLSEFINKSKWAHIDIAGPAYTEKGESYIPAGATGYGVRLLAEFLKSEVEKA